ncbi:NEL-type E3 ubiquitin ligase domain-containing protein [Pseudomonas sp. E2-15]
MGESTALRPHVCLNTYNAGKCGDRALLAFTNMEFEHQVHQAKEKSRTYESDRALIALATGHFYMNPLDQMSDKLIKQRETAGLEVDAAEVTVYFRAKLAGEFHLPFHPLQLLYSVDDYVTQEVLDDARAQLRRLGASPALQEFLLMEAFWIEYLARSHPGPFSTVKDSIKHKVRALDEELTDKRSEAYLERRQSLIDLGQDEQNRLVRQLTEATQAALLRA